ncbi:DNA polymerase III subunit beta [uncultured Bacteroides sp.]|uniref:DNA polymerase III subunit beta n=1 Tax=uncultured Bacteroides sp. TaxID=162156 RepID=UPI002AA6A562|nr:DNA polymerase III subunit beta [uncultured Bacteroides sp.]
MKITVSKSELYNKLSTIGKIISTRNSIPSFDNFMFVVDEGLLTITAGEEGGQLSTNIESITDMESFANVSFLIEAKIILDGLREIPEQPIVIEIEINKEFFDICVRYSNGKFELIGSNSDGYPTIDFDASEEPIKISSESFLYGIRQSQICCGNDELRPQLNGMLIEKVKNGITYVSSDGAMLGMVEHSHEGKEKSSFIVPGRMVRILSKMYLPVEEDVIITLGKGNIEISFGKYKMVCRMLEGRFPNYRSVIPLDNEKIATFNKADMVSALKRVEVFCNANSSLVILKFEENNLLISGYDFVFSTSAEENIEVSYTSDPIEIGFKSSALIDLLFNIPSTEVVMSMKEPSSAALLRRSDSEDLTYLIMPMTINH